MRNSEKRYIDHQSNELVTVLLGRNGEKGTAVIDAADFDFLIDLGLSSTWNALPNGYVTASAIRAKGGNVGVARVLLDAKEGQTIRYVDGNKANLRRENIQLRSGGFSTRRDRDFLTPIEIRRHRKPANAGAAL